MARFQPGTHVANHTIVRLIGLGYVAEVYEVIAPDAARRAMKLLKADAPLASKLPARLGQEIEAISMIDHVNVVRLHGSGVDDLDRVWMLLELVEGPDLRRLVREAGGRLPVERAVRIVRQACEGLAAAHALGILHRDLKPENLLVGPGDLCKLADFGSAKLAMWGGVQTTREQHLTSGLYMAPEQVLGKGADPRSDVYALALVLYEIIAGAHAIAPRPASTRELCHLQLTVVPPPLGSLGLGVPGDLSDLVDRLLSKQPSRRLDARQTADALGVVLQRLTVGRRAAARALALPNRGVGWAPTEPAMPAFAPPSPSGAPAATTGPRGTMLMAAFEAPAPVPPAGREALLPPPARADVAVTLRSPSYPEAAPRVVAASEAIPAAERASTGVPVERPAPRPSRGPRGLLPAAFAMGALFVVGLLGAGWLLVGREVGSPAGAPALTAGAASPRPPDVDGGSPAKPAAPRAAPPRARPPSP
jgi:eukaryotic-like serine/threonine-protein kinase